MRKALIHFQLSPWRNQSRIFPDLHPGFPLGDQYQLKQVIGEGGFGQVWTAVANSALNDPGRRPVIAVKILPTNSEQDRVYRGKPTLHRELEILQEIHKTIEQEGGRNPGIVQLFGSTVGPSRIYIHLEYGEISLGQFMNSNDNYPLPPAHALEISCQLLSAVAFLHRHGITHADVKPANVLLLSSNYLPNPKVDRRQWAKTYRESLPRKTEPPSSIKILQDRRVRLIDFGQSVHSSEGEITGRALTGTLVYRAPEMILGLPWTEKIDLWCLGLSLLEIWTGHHPFWDIKNSVQHLMRMESVLGAFTKELLQSCRTVEFGRTFLYKREANIAGRVLPWEKNGDHWRFAAVGYKAPQPIGNYFPTLGWSERCARSVVEKLMSLNPEDRGTADEALFNIESSG